MALFSSKESFNTLHESLAILKQMIVAQGKAIDDLRGTQLAHQGRTDDLHTDMKIFVTEKEERHEKHIGELAQTLAKSLDEAVQILRVLNQTMNQTMDKQATDIGELQRKVVILQARKA